MDCRNCGHGSLIQILDLGACPPSNSLLRKIDLNRPEMLYPLKLLLCNSCWLVQIEESKLAQEIFGDNYVYHSSVSLSWLAHAKAYVDLISKEIARDGKPYVVEVGSNDGYLLQYFDDSFQILGIEPSRVPANVAQERGIPTINEFFNTKTAAEVVQRNGRADLIIANNVFAHVPNVHDFTSALALLLNSDGIITIEFPHIGSLLDNVQFDTIYHEHFCYFSLGAVESILERHELEVFRLQKLATHGGSLRLFVQHTKTGNRTIEDSVACLRDEEKESGLLQESRYIEFAEAVYNVRDAFSDFLIKARVARKVVMGYGAAAKASMLLNYAGVRPDQLRCVADKSPYKQDHYIPGCRIPIVSPEELLEKKPDYIVIFAWNIADEIIDQLTPLIEWQCTFVVAIPKLCFIERKSPENFA
jgi:hypothetical protein